MEAHNVAGSTSADFTFVTLTKDGDPPPPEIEHRRNRTRIFYNDARLIITAIITVTVLICSGAIMIICCKYQQRKRQRRETNEQMKNAEVQRDRYYATIHKVALQAGDKIPESSEDISPYATFQLSEASTLAQPHHSGPANTLLHSFMYHERAMTEGCASPPPQVLRLHNQSPYYNINSKGKRRHSRKDPESEESDSDPDQLTSSRTESSNQLDAKLKHRTVPSTGIIYHGGQSSTSSDLSPPMSEQKSLPRRGRSRGTLRLPLQLAESSSERFHQIPIDGQATGTPDRIELSEAECDIDTLKKLKLGMKSSLWSRPNNGNSGGGGGGNQVIQPSHPSDYSIAV